VKIKLDECLPGECANLLASWGHQVDTVAEQGLQGSSDDVLWSAAQRDQRFLITTDLDFSDIRRYQPGKHAGVLLLRLHKEGKHSLLSYLKWLLSEYPLDDWRACLVIATDHKVRVKLPEK
jgi:predicted nuclease of predicted toxin-antitoxin system